MSTTQMNHTLSHRFVHEALAGGNKDAFDELVHPNVIAWTGLNPLGPLEGKDAYWEALGKLAAFTFTGFNLQDLLAVDDRVIARFHATARHTGDHLGVPATNREIIMWEVHLMRWQEGKLVENFVSDINYDWPWLIAPAYPDGVGKTGIIEGEE